MSQKRLCICIDTLQNIYFECWRIGFNVFVCTYTYTYTYVFILQHQKLDAAEVSDVGLYCFVLIFMCMIVNIGEMCLQRPPEQDIFMFLEQCHYFFQTTVRCSLEQCYY